jgi:predicted patatin/cPLA2 family phospholipase
MFLIKTKYENQKKGEMHMTQLNQLELQNLRHLIYSHETSAKKLESYAQQATDQQVKQMFQQSAQDARNTMQQLMSFLS